MNLLEFLGKFHPLVVHLPIGIMSLLVILIVFIPRAELGNSFKIFRLTLFISALAATFSSISGYILMISGAYSGNLVTSHQFLGISLMLINWIVLFKLKYLLRSSLVVYRLSFGFVFILMVLTGHAGGSLTHGSDFLVPSSALFSYQYQSEKTININTNAYEAVHLIVQEKCVVCHGPNKQKGKLRLDSQIGFQNGGKSGGLLGNINSSGLLLERIHLPVEDDDHMPPEERKQLTQNEIDFLTWWIERGASFDQTLSELNFPDSLSEILIQAEVPDPFIPTVLADPPDLKLVNKIRELGVVIKPIAQKNSYLSANFINVPDENVDEAFASLDNIKDQLIFLYIEDRQLNENSLEMIGLLSQLRKLSLRQTHFDVSSLSHLNKLENLVSLNLVGTEVNKESLENLKALSNLKFLFLYQTKLQSEDIIHLNEIFQGAIIDTGHYLVPTLASDTTVLRLRK